jgi:hypothetical protein
VTAVPSSRPTRLRGVAIGLLGVAAFVILSSEVAIYRALPVDVNTTPNGVLGATGSLKLVAILTALWSTLGLVLGGWKVALVAIGRQASLGRGTFVWFGLFAAFYVWLAVETVELFISPS